MNDLVSSPAERERLFAEIRVLKQLKHKNIVSVWRLGSVVAKQQGGGGALGGSTRGSSEYAQEI